MIGSFFHDCLPPLAQVGVDRAKLPAVGDVRQAGVDVFEVLGRDVAAAQTVDVAHSAGAVFQVIQGPADLGEERPAVGGKALGLVHNGQGLHMGQGLGQLLRREGAEDAKEAM